MVVFRVAPLAVSDETLQARRDAMNARGKDAWQPTEERGRVVSQALRAYAALATSADRGAVRDVSQILRK